MSCYIKELRNKVKVLEFGLKTIASKFYCIGGPLNDNIDNFNDKQKEYFYLLKVQIEQILEDSNEESK